MSLAETVQFLRSYLDDPSTVGAVAPSSRRLAKALVQPFAARTGASRVLELGAGTGRVTRCIASLMGPDDHLDVCEIKEDLADALETNVLSEAGCRRARVDGRIRLLRCPAQDIHDSQGYDYIISGLPFTAFDPVLLDAVMSSVRRNLRPGGVFSYFEYVGLRKLNRTLSLGSGRQRIRSVSGVLDGHISRHQFRRETVLFNLPPAYARHWRFA
ncbi:MAG: methyltransferase domain-containing protein [bacterium]|nr:methyltransferase domain-containing protein [bacterium]